MQKRTFASDSSIKRLRHACPFDPLQCPARAHPDFRAHPPGRQGFRFRREISGKRQNAVKPAMPSAQNLIEVVYIGKRRKYHRVGVLNPDTMRKPSPWSGGGRKPDMPVQSEQIAHNTQGISSFRVCHMICKRAEIRYQTTPTHDGEVLLLRRAPKLRS